MAIRPSYASANDDKAPPVEASKKTAAIEADDDKPTPAEASEETEMLKATHAPADNNNPKALRP